jgi:hypothetical protein
LAQIPEAGKFKATNTTNLDSSIKADVRVQEAHDESEGKKNAKKCQQNHLRSGHK